MSDHEFEFDFETHALHVGSRQEPTTAARALPIYQTTSYVFEDTEAAAAYFNLQEYGNTCSRIMNPTVAAFEERMANPDQGAGAVAEYLDQHPRVSRVSHPGLPGSRYC